LPAELFTPLVLPNGTSLPNRLAKAAMEENMSNPGQVPGERLQCLYAAWAQGGVGLIITGNVMVDARALTGPGGVVLQKGMPLEPFKRWAQVARSGGAQVWMQINHPGRQVMASMGQPGWGPSEVQVDLGKHSRLIAKPRAMTEDEITAVIGKFVDTAVLAHQAGFNGVEVHAAHGYLLSQFLSPLVNQRTDGWGGSLINRARLLLEIVRGIRAVVPADFVSPSNSIPPIFSAEDLIPRTQPLSSTCSTTARSIWWNCQVAATKRPPCMVRPEMAARSPGKPIFWSLPRTSPQLRRCQSW